jgi:fimbrial chaperone protein
MVPARLASTIKAAMLVIVALAMATVAHAYEVSPMRIFLQPSRGQSSATIAVNNIRTDSLPIEVKVLRRLVNPDGSQTFQPADDKFVIFPPQAQIAAGQSQALRVQYTGDAVTESEAYVIQVTEVPVNRLEQSGIQFTYNFGVAVYVQANRPRARLAIENTRIVEGKLRFKVANSGNDFAFINGQQLEYQIGDEKFRLDRDALTNLVENPIISPNSEREFSLSLDNLIDGTPVKVRLSRADG